MNEQYISNLYNSLGGQDVFGDFKDFKSLITTNEDYASNVYNELGGESVFGKYDDFSTVLGLKKKGISGQGSQTGSEMSDTGSTLSQGFRQATQEESELFKGLGPSSEESYMGAINPSADMIAESLTEGGKTLGVVKKKHNNLGEKFDYFNIDDEQNLVPGDIKRLLKSVDHEFVALPEEKAVPRLNYMFGPYGFSFEQTGLGDYVNVTAPDGETAEFSFSAFFDDPVKNTLESQRIRNFIGNKSKDLGLKERDGEQIVFTSEEDVKREVSLLKREVDIFNSQYELLEKKKSELDNLKNKIDSVPQRLRGSEEYLNDLENFKKMSDDYSLQAQGVERLQSVIKSKSEKVDSDIQEYQKSFNKPVSGIDDVYENLKEAVPAAIEGILSIPKVLPTLAERELRDLGLNKIADIMSFMAANPKDKVDMMMSGDYSIESEFAESLESIMEKMKRTTPVESYDAATESGDIRRMWLMAVGNAANFVPSLAVGAGVGLMTGGNVVAGGAAFSAMFAGQEMASAAEAIAAESGRTIAQVIKDRDESILIPAIIGVAAGTLETIGFKFFTKAVKGFLGDALLKNLLVNVPVNAAWQGMANTLESAMSVYNEVHSTTGSHQEAAKLAGEFLIEEGPDVFKSTVAGQLVMVGVSGGVTLSGKVASEYLDRKLNRKTSASETADSVVQAVINEGGIVEDTSIGERQIDTQKLQFGEIDYNFKRNRDGNMELAEEPMSKDQATSTTEVLGRAHPELQFSIEAIPSNDAYSPVQYKVISSPKAEGSYSVGGKKSERIDIFDKIKKAKTQEDINGISIQNDAELEALLLEKATELGVKAPESSTKIPESSTASEMVSTEEKPLISEMKGESVTVNVAGENISGIVNVDEGGKVTLEFENKVYELSPDTEYRKFERPVEVSESGDFIVNGESFVEARITIENGKKKALLIREDNTTKAVTNDNLVEEIEKNIALSERIEATNQRIESGIQSIPTNSAAEIDRVKASTNPAGDGATFNLDGTTAPSEGLVVPVVSKNLSEAEMTPQAVADFVAENKSKIGNDEAVKVGIYKFPDGTGYSIDLNVLIKPGDKKIGLEFGKAAGQESLFNLETNKGEPTGADGKNPMSFSDAQFKEIANALKEGRIPDFMSTKKEESSVKPGNRLFNKPLADAAKIANDYFKKAFKKVRPVFTGTRKLDTKLSKRISDAYEAMKHDPNNPRVREAYNALAKETLEQYNAFTNAGYVVEINNSEPYANSAEMIEDLRNNKRIKIFSTESGFGDTAITEQQRKENPLLKDSGLKDVNGQTLLINDLFRAVHDFFGHSELGNSFGAKGEENAWNVHARMFSKKARAAMTSETRGQNSYVNFSGVNKKIDAMREEARKLREEGKIEEAEAIVQKIYEEGSFAEQKVGLLPSEFWQINEKDTGDAGIGVEAKQKDTPLSIKDSIDKSAQALKLSFPNTKFIVGESLENTREKIFEALRSEFGDKEARRVANDFNNAAGQALFVGGRPVAVVIDSSAANSRTAAHEVWEVILNQAFNNDQKKFGLFKNAIDKYLRANGYIEIADRLTQFSENYNGPDQFREYMAEFGGVLTSGSLNINIESLTQREKGLIEKIKELVNKFSQAMIGQDVFLANATEKNIIGFMTAISEKIAKGKDFSSMIGLSPNAFGERTEGQVIEIRKQYEARKNPINFNNSKDFANKSAFKNKLEFKEALQQKLKDYLPELRKEYGENFDPSIYNNKTKEYLVDSLFTELLDAVEAHPEAIGWYDTKTKQALDAMSVIYPEITTDMEARGAFIAALAITSNGNKVSKNFEYTSMQYEHQKRTGRFNSDLDMGGQQSGIKASFKMINEMLDSGMSWKDINNFFTSTYRAGDLHYYKVNKKGKKTKVNLVSGELVETEVYGAVILGSKIGDGFYMNLWGQFNKLTMDRWFMRTFGRLTGTLVLRNPETIKKSKDRLINALNEVKKNTEAKRVLKSVLGPTSSMSIDDIAALIFKKSMDKSMRSILNSTPLLEEVRKSGNTYNKNISGEKEAPANGKERKFIRSVFEDLQSKFNQYTNGNIEMADIQAVLWYPEKILYESFKEGETYENASEGYTEDSAPDYYNAAKSLLNKKGITNDKINETLRKRAGDPRPGVGGRSAESSRITEESKKNLSRKVIDIKSNIPSTEEGMNSIESRSQRPDKKMPSSFDSIGSKGKILFEKAVAHVNSTAKYTSTDAAIGSGIILIQESAEYKKLLKEDADFITTDAMIREFQSFMGLSMRKAPSIEKLFSIPVEGKSIRQEIKRNLKLQDKGAKQLQRFKTQIRNLIWHNIPNTLYKKVEVMKMIDSINKAKDIDSLDAMIDVVIDFSTKKKSEQAISSIDKILNDKYVSRDGSVPVGKKVSLRVKELFDYIKSKPTQDEVIKRREALEKKVREESRSYTQEEVDELMALTAAEEIFSAGLMAESDVSRLNSLMEALENIIALRDGGRAELRAELNRQSQKYIKEKEIVYKGITGRDFDNSDQGKAERSSQNLSKEQKEKRAKLLPRIYNSISKKISDFFVSQESLNGLIDIIQKSTGEMFGGPIQELVSDKVDISSFIYKENIMSVKNAIEEKLIELYGKNKENTLVRNRLQKETNIILPDGNKLFLSIDEAAYLYNQSKDPANKSALEAKFPGVNIDKVIDALKADFIPAERLEFSDWMTDTLFPSLYDKYNSVYKRVNRTNMPWNSKYAGKLYREGDGPEVRNVLDETNNIRSSTTNGSMLERVENNRPIILMNEMDALLTYIEDMEFFHAYAENMRDIQKLFRDKDIRDAIKRNGEDYVLPHIDEAIKGIISRGMTGERTAKFVNAMTDLFVVSKLGINPTVGIKQLTSAIAYSPEIGIENWVLYGAKATANPLSIWNEIVANSPYIKFRYDQSIRKSLEAYSESGISAYVPNSSGSKFIDLMMYMIKQGDKGGIMGGIPNYLYHKNQYMKKNPGASEKDAIKHAAFKFQKTTKQTQQSPDQQDKDSFQRNPNLRWLNLFQTSQRQYLRKIYSSVRQMNRRVSNVKSSAMTLLDGKQRDKVGTTGTLRQNIETFLMFHSALPMLFQYVTLGFPGIGSDWDKEKFKAMARAGVLGNLNAIFLIGPIIQSFQDMAANAPWASDTQTLPVFDSISKIIKSLQRYNKSVGEKTKEKHLDRAKLEALSLFGLPAPQVNNIYKNLDALMSKDEPLNIQMLRIMMFSQYVIDGAKDSSLEGPQTGIDVSNVSKDQIKKIREMDVDMANELERMKKEMSDLKKEMMNTPEMKEMQRERKRFEEELKKNR